MNISLHVYMHGSAEQQSKIERVLSHLLLEGKKMTQVVDDLVAQVSLVKDAVAKFGPAVDAFEARITVLIGNGGMSQADKDAVAAAIADLKSVVGVADAAVADAGDGVDEAATTGTTGPT